MSAEADADIEALKAELKNLRADFTKIADILKDTARNRGAEAAESFGKPRSAAGAGPGARRRPCWRKWKSARSVRR